jgi:hypothetical protein
MATDMTLVGCCLCCTAHVVASKPPHKHSLPPRLSARSSRCGRGIAGVDQQLCLLVDPVHAHIFVWPTVLALGRQSRRQRCACLPAIGRGEVKVEDVCESPAARLVSCARSMRS